VNACRRRGPTLVHCTAGVNRSALIVAAALIQEGMDAAPAIALLRAKRGPDVLFNQNFERWLLTDGARNLQLR
jgi:protein-tyrosine phosphatase